MFALVQQLKKTKVLFCSKYSCTNQKLLQQLKKNWHLQWKFRLFFHEDIVSENCHRKQCRSSQSKNRLWDCRWIEGKNSKKAFEKLIVNECAMQNETVLVLMNEPEKRAEKLQKCVLCYIYTILRISIAFQLSFVLFILQKTSPAVIHKNRPGLSA